MHTIELRAIYIVLQTPRETTMSVNVLYKTSAKATGGRDGHAATLDGALDVKLTTPKNSAAAAVPATIPSSCSRPAMPPASSAR
jgi:hypothetical protein